MREPIDETEFELCLCEVDATVVAVVLTLSGMEVLEAVAVLGHRVLDLSSGDSGGVGGMSVGGSGGSRGESKAELDGGVGMGKQFGGCSGAEGAR